MLYSIKLWLLSFPFVRNVLFFKYSHLDLIYKTDDLNDEYYKIIRSAQNNKEAEHQIGRLTNYKKILTEIKNNNIQGDIIEFGAWRGFSLLWISYLSERLGLFEKKIAGIDSFAGLPGSEGIFKRGNFSDTSLKECRENIYKSKDLYSITKKNIHIEKLSFSQKKEMIEWLKNIGITNFCFIHIDCDISSSAIEIFDLLLEENLIGDKCYILFDDYGWMESYQKTVDEIINKMKINWNVSVHSSTNLTKNFFFNKNK
jgi:hypothetical protein